MIVIESKDGKLRIKSTKSINLKSDKEVEEFSERARKNPTEKEKALSEQMGFVENVFGKEISLNGSSFFLTGIRPNNKKPIVFQEKGKWWSYLYLHPAGIRTHIPELACKLKKK